jgi:VIT1/CCC1 family predicted Fe2+/Mn2+ transporter
MTNPSHGVPAPAGDAAAAAADLENSVHGGSVVSDTPSVQLYKTQHLGQNRQYWRDMILGVDDGLISTFLLVVGVAGGGLGSVQILLTGIAGSLAGAVSMFAGEYIATKSQNEVFTREIALEKKHVELYLDSELKELDQLHLIRIGIPTHETELRRHLMQFYRTNPDALLEIMTVLEFGVVEMEERSPILAGVTSGFTYFLGSLPSIIPFIFSADRPSVGVIAAAAATIFTLLIVGAVKCWATKGNIFVSSMENLLIAGLGGGLAYGVGVGFGQVVH